MLECFESPIFKYYNIFKGDVIATFTATAPPPQKDFFQLQILKDKIFWRKWRITSRNDSEKYNPFQFQVTYTQFGDNDRLRYEIKNVMGESVLRFCDSIVRGHLDFLPRMPLPIIKNILSHVNAEDIINFGSCSKATFLISRDDNIWRDAYCRYHEEPPNDAVNELARTHGWKHVFFMSKLKLQMQIRRLKLEKGEPKGDQSSNESDSSPTEKSDSLRDAE